MNSEEQSKAAGLLNYLFEQPESRCFSQPLDFRALGLLDYPLIIKTPMDLFTIKQKLQKNYYLSLVEFLSDIILIWDNSRVYYLPDSSIVRNVEFMEAAMTRYCSLHSISLEFACQRAKITEHPDWISLSEKMELAEVLKQLDPKKLGLLLDVIETECPLAVSKANDGLQIRIDALDRTIFNRISEMANPLNTNLY